MKHLVSFTKKNHSKQSQLNTVLTPLVTGITLVFAMTASSAYAANIAVTTSEDKVVKDNKCSLREAVAFVNSGTTDTESDCYPSDENPSTIIELNTDEPHTLSEEIVISASATIQSNLINDISNLDGEQVAVINAPNSRVFSVDDKLASKGNMSVFLKGLDLRGASVINSADDEQSEETQGINDGGLIYNRENLTLEKVRLSGGVANKGGAIYNASLDAKLTIKSSEISNNLADEGAGVFSETTNYLVSNSLFTANKSKENNSAFALQTTLPNVLSSVGKQNGDQPFELDIKGKIANTTFYDNANIGAFNLVAGVEANNLTVISNGKGVALESSFTADFTDDSYQVVGARLANSVLLNNTDYDLSVASDDTSFLNHLVTSNNITGQLLAGYGYKVNQLAPAQLTNLIAQETVTDDSSNDSATSSIICAAPLANETTGLFCPLIKQKDEFIANVKPRLLMSYEKVANSPIVNQGKTGLNDNADLSDEDARLNDIALNCEKNDMRGESRTICDIGAFELNIIKANSSTVKEVNAEMPFNTDAILPLKDISADGQLVPASECDKYVSNPPTQAEQWLSGVVGTWTDGCITFLGDKHPEKGTLVLSEAKDQLIYTPERRFHGLDRFEYQLITTTSRFSESENDRNIRAKSKIYQYPDTEFESKTIGLGYSDGTGSFSWQWLAMFMSMVGWSAFGFRRKK